MKWPMLSIASELMLIDWMAIPWQVCWFLLKRTGWATSTYGVCPHATREQTTSVKAGIKKKWSLILFLPKGYHNRMNSRIYRNHPNVWLFIKFPQDEEKRVQWIPIQWLAGAIKKKNLRTTNLQNQMNTLNSWYANNLISASDLLLGFSYRVTTKSK